MRIFKKKKKRKRNFIKKRVISYKVKWLQYFRTQIETREDHIANRGAITSEAAQQRIAAGGSDVPQQYSQLETELRQTKVCVISKK